jgi:hypothetical protein
LHEEGAPTEDVSDVEDDENHHDDNVIEAEVAQFWAYMNSKSEDDLLEAYKKRLC